MTEPDRPVSRDYMGGLAHRMMHAAAHPTVVQDLIRRHQRLSISPDVADAELFAVGIGILCELGFHTRATARELADREGRDLVGSAISGGIIESPDLTERMRFMSMEAIAIVNAAIADDHDAITAAASALAAEGIDWPELIGCALAIVQSIDMSGAQAVRIRLDDIGDMTP